MNKSGWVARPNIEQQLRVYYDGPGINVELDKAIEEALGKFGFERWASGYDLVENIRDLAFDKKKE